METKERSLSSLAEYGFELEPAVVLAWIRSRDSVEIEDDAESEILHLDLGCDGDEVPRVESGYLSLLEALERGTCRIPVLITGELNRAVAAGLIRDYDLAVFNKGLETQI